MLHVLNLAMEKSRVIYIVKINKSWIILFEFMLILHDLTSNLGMEKVGLSNQPE